MPPRKAMALMVGVAVATLGTPGVALADGSGSASQTCPPAPPYTYSYVTVTYKGRDISPWTVTHGTVHVSVTTSSALIDPAAVTVVLASEPDGCVTVTYKTQAPRTTPSEITITHYQSTASP